MGNVYQPLISETRSTIPVTLNNWIHFDKYDERLIDLLCFCKVYNNHTGISETRGKITLTWNSCVCPKPGRTWIPNTICRGLVCVCVCFECFDVRGSFLVIIEGIIGYVMVIQLYVIA